MKEMSWRGRSSAYKPSFVPLREDLQPSLTQCRFQRSHSCPINRGQLPTGGPSCPVRRSRSEPGTFLDHGPVTELPQSYSCRTERDPMKSNARQEQKEDSSQYHQEFATAYIQFKPQRMFSETRFYDMKQTTRATSWLYCPVAYIHLTFTK